MRKRRRPYKKRDPTITSAIMRVIRGRENRAEVSLRKALWRKGLRYRIYARDLIGKPDVVFIRSRVAVFVDGDYWHGRALREGGPKHLREVIRGERFEYWRERFQRNMDRDDRVTSSLREQGWTVIRLWESEILADVDRAAQFVEKRITLARASLGNRRERRGGTPFGGASSK